MNLSQIIRNRLRQKKILLMTHLVVGYPSIEENWRMLEAMSQADVDLVELQMPFSEPSADGPLFVKANQESLRNGTRLEDYFLMMREAAEKFTIPLLMMGYCNTAFRMGYPKFTRRVSKNGGSGFIIPDLPIEEFGDLFALSRKNGIHPILLCTPTNTDERLREICLHASGFVYCVARKGVTGQTTRLGAEVESFLSRCRKYTDLPLALGFGLSQPEDMRLLPGSAEIAIVGSALLRTWESGGIAAYRDQLVSLAEARD